MAIGNEKYAYYSLSLIIGCVIGWLAVSLVFRDRRIIDTVENVGTGENAREDKGQRAKSKPLISDLVSFGEFAQGASGEMMLGALGKGKLRNSGYAFIVVGWIFQQTESGQERLRLLRQFAKSPDDARGLASVLLDYSPSLCARFMAGSDYAFANGVVEETFSRIPSNGLALAEEILPELPETNLGPGIVGLLMSAGFDTVEALSNRIEKMSRKQRNALASADVSKLAEVQFERLISIQIDSLPNHLQMLLQTIRFRNDPSGLIDQLDVLKESDVEAVEEGLQDTQDINAIRSVLESMDSRGDITADSELIVRTYSALVQAYARLTYSDQGSIESADLYRFVASIPRGRYREQIDQHFQKRYGVVLEFNE